MSLAPHPAVSAPPWLRSAGQPATVAAAIRAWWEQACQAYPEATLRAWKFDWNAFLGFCQHAGHSPLPADPESLVAFIAACRAQGKKPATVRRYLSTIALAHRVARLTNPVVAESVQLALKGFSRAVSIRQRQARALGWLEIQKFLDTAGLGIRADRERALLCVAYDTMARRSELIALNVEDLQFLPDGTGRVLIRRAKTDQAGEGAIAYLARDTVRLLTNWLHAAGITQGALFRRLVGRDAVGERLQVDAIAQIFKRVARWVGMPSGQIAEISGHSIRVGATQDLFALNIDMVSVMQAGRWKSVRMPARYGEHVLAARSGMARAALAQGRDIPRPA